MIVPGDLMTTQYYSDHMTPQYNRTRYVDFERQCMLKYYAGFLQSTDNTVTHASFNFVSDAATTFYDTQYEGNPLCRQQFHITKRSSELLRISKSRLQHPVINFHQST